MSKIIDLVLLRNWAKRSENELDDEMMMQMMRAAADELEELCALVHHIAINTRDPDKELPGGAERKLRMISAMLKDYGR